METADKNSEVSTRPVLAIIMICHNDARHLRRSIGAITEQLRGDVKFLFVDDSSTDNTLEIAKSLVGDRGEVVRTPRNMNVGGARNFGYLHLKEAENPPKYVWFHDSDDYITDDAVDRILAALAANEGVDLLSIPFGERMYDERTGAITVNGHEIQARGVTEAASTPVGAWCKVIKFEKFVPFACDQYCEHVAWHYLLFDRVDTWAKIPGAEPCYVWDRTNDEAITRTVDFCRSNPNTLEALILNNTLSRNGLCDKWVSDFLRNLANMYDVRHLISKPEVKRIWFARFRMEYANFMCGRYVH